MPSDPADAHRRLDILCFGEPLVEFTRVTSPPHHFVQGFGGDTSNTAIVATAHVRQQIPAPRVGVVDATGAGDVFNGAFLVEFLETSSGIEAATYGVAAAALSTTAYGAAAAIPTRDEVDAISRSGTRRWGRNSVAIAKIQFRRGNGLGKVLMHSSRHYGSPQHRN